LSIDASIPTNSYVISPNKWSDGSRSDVAYASTTITNDSLPPVLIELQYQVDQDFMLRIIKYASHVYKWYKVLPVIVVFVTKSFSSADFQREFITLKNSVLLEAICQFWAKRCFLLTPDAFRKHSNTRPLDPIVALGVFLTRDEQTTVADHLNSKCQSQKLKKI
jgi:hypothetical protein